MAQILFVGLSAQDATLEDLQSQLQKATTPEKKIEALLALSDNRKGKDFQAALDYADEAINLSLATNNKSRTGAAYTARANAYNFAAKYEEAIEFYAKAHTLFTEEQDKPKISSALNDLGMMYSQVGRYTLAMEYFSESLKIDAETKDTASIAASYTNIAGVLMKENKFQEAIDTLEEVLLIDSLMGDWEYYTQDLGNIATLYRALGEYNIALDYAIRGYTMADSLGSSMGAYQAAGTIADTYRTLEYKENALDFAQKTLTHAKETHKSTLISDAYARVQMAYQGLGNTALTLINFDSAMVYAAPDSKSTLYNNLGVYFDNTLDNSDSALKYYDLAIGFSQSNSESINKYIIPLINKGIIYRELGEIDRSLGIIEQALEFAKKEEYKLRISFLKEIAETYSAAGQPQKGYEFLSQAVSRQDSLLDTEQKAEDKLLAYEKKSRELTIKEQELALVANGQKLWKRTALIFILGFILLAAFVIAYLLKKKNAELAKLNVKLEYLSNEIHHRVKNDFQSISSMIFIQANDIQLAKVKQALLGVRDRILAMGQIHMLFYEEEGYLKMGFRNYLKRLVENRYSTLSAQFNMASAELTIDIDEVLPDPINFQEAKQLGIIINELITNAYKYALKEDRFSTLNFSAKVLEGNELKIEVSDNGDAIDENFNIKNTASFGLKMISYMCEKLRWEFSFQKKLDKSIFRIIIPSA